MKFLIFSVFLILLVSGCVQQTNQNKQTTENISVKETIAIEPLDTDFTSIKSELQFVMQSGGGISPESYKEIDDKIKRLEDAGYDKAKTDELKAMFSHASGSQTNCVKNPNPIFTIPFTDNSKILAVSPLGGASFTNPGASMRSYISMKHEEPGAPMIPVYAPIDSMITIIVYAERHLEEFGTPGEYRIGFQVSCEVSYTLDHLADVVDKIKEFAPKTATPTPGFKAAPGVEVNIPVRAGELVGYTNRNTIAHNWDFIVQNKAVKKNFINPDRWVGDHSLYGVCPYDYFTEDLKNFYYSVLYKIHPRQPVCGDTVREISGTLAGAWFQGDANENNGSRMSFVGDVHSTVIDIIRGNGERFSLRDTNGGRIPQEDVVVGEQVCYYDSQKNVFAFVKLVSETQIELATGDGQCSSVPTESEIWLR